MKARIVLPIIVSLVLSPAVPSTCYSAQPARSAETRLEFLPTTVGLQTPFAVYRSAGAGISIDFPKDWKESKPQEKEAVVKFDSAGAGGVFAEVRLDRHDAPGSTASSIKHLVESFVFIQIKDFKKLQEKKVGIGPKRTVPALLEDVTYPINGVKFQQRYVFFDINGSCYVLIFTAPAEQFDKLVPVFNHVLLSVQPSNTSAGKTRSTPSASTNTPAATTAAATASGAVEKPVSMKRYEASSLPVSFTYPDSWKVSADTHADEPVNISGTDSKGAHASIVLNRGESHPWVSIDEMADSLEKEYFQSLKNFRRVRRDSQNFGTMSKVSGVVQEQSFQKDGQSVKQMVAMFYHGNKTYALSLLAPAWKESDMHQLFSKVLASVELKD